MEGSGSGARRSDESDGASRSRGRLARIGPHSPLTRVDWALPAQPSALIGRAGQLAAAQRLLVRADVRLLTLTGPAGVGKTRLAVALAERVGAHFPDGVGFVDLTPIGDQRQVVPTISRALGAPPPAGRTSLQALQDFLERRTALVVLDNFEHVLDAAPHLAEILTACPCLTLVVTSRAALHLRWEHVLPVPPLALPDTRHLASPASLVRKASVALFVDRARAVAPAFALTVENGPAVAELCIRLDGLPLAIELAARQVGIYPPPTMLQRLTRAISDRAAHADPTTGPIRALGQGPRDLPARQQTLESAIAWSYDLLTTEEQAAFRRLSVFEGGFDAGAGSWMIGHGDPDGPLSPSIAHHPSPITHDLLSRLVDSSLLVRDVRPDRSQPRYRLLETIRQFAADRLAEAGETATARTAHLAWCLHLAETGYRKLRTGRASEWRTRLDGEYENFRAALAWSEEQEEHAPFARLVAALWWCWHLHGLIGETHHYFARALEIETAPSAVRAHLLNGAAVFAYDRGEYGPAEALATEARALCQALGDQWGTALAQISLGFVAYLRGDYDRAAVLLDEGLALARAAHDFVTAARALNNLGSVALARGDLDSARPLFEESLKLWRQLQSAGATALTLWLLGQVAHEQGDQQRATTLLEESVGLARQSGYARAASPALFLLGRVAQSLGQWPRATTLFLESLAVRREQGDRRGIAECFEGLAASAEARRKPADAARLLGAADALRATIGAPIPAHAIPAREQLVAGLKRRLGSRYDDLRAEGAALALDEALRFALGSSTAASTNRRPRPARRATSTDDGRTEGPSPTLLSPREREVAALVARGLSNREIAAALVVAEGSAANYVKRILAKLGFRTRTQVAVWADRHALTDPPGG